MASSSATQAGYLELVRTNVHFRRLWLGNLISQLGDWFNTIALYSLIDSLTGSPLALGAVFLFKLLPWSFASPIAGILVDRYNRRWVMIISDLLRAVVVLGFLWIDDPSHVTFIFILITLQVVLGSVFSPAKNASIPNITAPRELLTANALSSATWSVMLALGAGLGGLATEYLGTDTVFILDSLTYLISAAFIYRTVIPQQTETVRRIQRISYSLSRDCRWVDVHAKRTARWPDSPCQNDLGNRRRRYGLYAHLVGTGSFPERSGSRHRHLIFYPRRGDGRRADCCQGSIQRSTDMAHCNWRIRNRKRCFLHDRRYVLLGCMDNDRRLSGALRQWRQLGPGHCYSSGTLRRPASRASVFDRVAARLVRRKYFDIVREFDPGKRNALPPERIYSICRRANYLWSIMATDHCAG